MILHVCYVSGFPEITTQPEVTLEYVTLTDMSLSCAIKDNASDVIDNQVVNIQYEVTWYREDVNITSELLIAGLLTHNLNVSTTDFVDRQKVSYKSS